MKLQDKVLILLVAVLITLGGCGSASTPRVTEEEIAGYIMVSIPGATFDMGYLFEYDPSIPDNVNRYISDEQPVHEVTLSPYQIGKTEVTQALYERIMGENPSTFKGSDLPVTNVGASRALEFCNSLSEASGLEKAYDPETGKVDFSKNGFRLPTEAEWEYACRAGTTTIFSTGMTAADLDRAGWYIDNSDGKTHPVAQKEPNAFGLYDMHGNVFEFCYDGYSDPPVEAAYPPQHVTDPISSEDFNYRMMRGGGWFSEPYSCRSYTRSKFWTGGANYYIGFRLARSLRHTNGEEKEMNLLKDQLIKSMKNQFGDDQKRISHTMSVLEYAQEILHEEGGNSPVVIAAAILHDIGIQEAERKHGSSAGKYQEIEGPPIARKILENIGLESSAIEHVCLIVGNHHSARDIDTSEFRIVWDADWLVNFPDEYASFEKNKRRSIIDRIFKTKTGKKKAYRLFLE